MDSGVELVKLARMEVLYFSAYGDFWLLQVQHAAVLLRVCRGKRSRLQFNGGIKVPHADFLGITASYACRDKVPPPLAGALCPRAKLMGHTAAVHSKPQAFSNPCTHVQAFSSCSFNLTIN